MKTNEEADFVEVVAVAIVLVSTRFLTSHAYLKDSAVCIQACAQADRVPLQSPSDPKKLRTSGSAVHSAHLEARELPVKAQQNSDPNAHQALGNLHGTQPQGTMETPVSSAELAGLCGLGERSPFLQWRNLHTDTQPSVAIARVDKKPAAC